MTDSEVFEPSSRDRPLSMKINPHYNVSEMILTELRVLSN